ARGYIGGGPARTERHLSVDQQLWELAGAAGGDGGGVH
ncbi:unnamed protein product, partial [Urochloa humidicola]